MGPTTISLTCFLFVSGVGVVDMDRRSSAEESLTTVTQEQTEAETIREEIAALKKSAQLLNRQIERLEFRLERLENTIRKRAHDAEPSKSLLEEHWERGEPFFWDMKDSISPLIDIRIKIRFRPAPEKQLLPVRWR